MKLSEFAGGYCRQFATTVIQGAEDYLRGALRSFLVLAAEDEAEEQDQLREERFFQARQGTRVFSKLSQLEVIHRRPGHLSTEALTRMLKLAGAEKWLIEEAKDLKCPACEAM